MPHPFNVNGAKLYEEKRPMMISKEALDNYENRAYSLVYLFMESCSKSRDLVVEDSPVDYATHKFICLTHRSNYDALLLWIAFYSRSLSRDRDDARARKLVKEFHSLEEQLVFQNEFLEKHASMHTARAGDDK